jgi:hypothetical protein
MVSTKEYFNHLNILCYAMLAGQILFALIARFVLLTPDATPQYIIGPQEDLYGLVAYMLAMVFLSRFMDHSRMKSAATLKKLDGDTFTHYRSTVILRLAILEGAALFIIVLAIVTYNALMLWLTGPMLLAFFLARPTAEEFDRRYT